MFVYLSVNVVSVIKIGSGIQNVPTLMGQQQHNNVRENAFHLVRVFKH